MRLLIQRVLEAKVVVDNKTVGQIEQGALVFFACHQDDKFSQIPWLANKLAHLRMFTDDFGKMNLSLLDIQKDVLVVSQFTLYADCSTGRRPSFTQSLEPVKAKNYYEAFVEELKKTFLHIETGVFGAKMRVHLINDGPVTFLVDAKL